MFFTSLELAALAGVAVFGGNYSTKTDEYNVELSAYEEWWNDVSITGEWASSEQTNNQQIVNDAYAAQKQAKNGLIGCAAVSGVVWLWNIIDVKKTKSKRYSDNNRFSIGINHNGYVEARISF